MITAEQIAAALDGTPSTDGFLAHCPAHSDATPSLSITEANGRILVHCHAGCSQEAVLDALRARGLWNGAHRESSGSPVRTAVKEREPSIPFPLPVEDARKLYSPDALQAVANAAGWGVMDVTPSGPYRDSDGRVLGYDARFDKDGHKTVITFWSPDGRTLATKNPPSLLSSFDELAARPAAPVLILEGMKCRNVAAKALPGFVCVTWNGGSGRVASAPWSALDGRAVTIWRDADGPGQKAAKAIQEHLPNAQVLEVDDKADGWDCADAAAEGMDLETFIAERMPRPGAEDASLGEAAARKLREVISALAPLEDREYGVARLDIAKRLNVTVTALDKVYAEAHPQAKKRYTPEPEEEIPDNADGSMIAGIVERHLGKQVEARKCKTRRNCTEAGNAARFIDLFGDEVRFNHTQDSWLLWDGRRWASDDAGRIGFLVSETLRSIYHEAGAADTEEEREVLAKWAMKSERAAVTTAVLKLAPSEPAVAVTSESLDTNTWLLNVKNGTLDLHTGRMHEPQRAELITMLAPVTYDPDARAPIWDAFVEDVLPDIEVRQFAQTLAGYCLTGDTTAQVFPLAFGAGRNGKTTFFQTLREMLGDYAGEMSPDALMATRYSDGGKTATPQVAGTAGKRMIVASESTTGAKLDDALIKLYTGGEKVVARFLHSNPFSFKPTAKLILFTNHKPKIPATDLGIWRRVKLIPFTVTIAEDKADEALPSKLREEWPGILNWCLQGLARYQEKGLQAPEAIMKATGVYRDSEDVLGAFLDDECEKVPGEKARSAPLFKKYQKWCEAENERVLSSKDFKAALEEKGFHHTRDGVGVLFLGLRMKPEAPSGSNATPQGVLGM